MASLMMTGGMQTDKKSENAERRSKAKNVIVMFTGIKQGKSHVVTF